MKVKRPKKKNDVKPKRESIVMPKNTNVKVGDVVLITIPARVIASGLEGDAPTDGSKDKRRLVLSVIETEQKNQHTVYADEVEVQTKPEEPEPEAPTTDEAGS